MKLLYSPYQRPFATAFAYGNNLLTERLGFCLRLETPEGTFYSEASPLPGHSRDTFAQVEERLKNIDETYFSHPESFPDLPPALSFGLEGLILQKKQPGFIQSVPVNAVVPWQGLTTTEAALKKKEEGYDTVKIKIPTGQIQDVLAVLQALAPTNLKIRLDANRSLTENELEILFSALAKIDSSFIEYLEEPFAHWRAPVLSQAPIPLAADECAADPRFWKVLLLNHKPEVFVLKPMVAGGLTSLAQKAKILTAHGRKVVYSSSLEAEPGRRALLSFLSAENPATSSGMATGFFFAENFLPDQSLFSSLPKPSIEEQRWLDHLPWQVASR